MASNQRVQSGVRLDKWLWAARFFKTRSLAKQAIEAGHVHYDDARTKVSKEVAIGASLRIRHGWDQKTVIVQGLSSSRGPASIAQTLYQETSESIAAREQHAAERKASGVQPPPGRPDKRNRRLIHRFKTDSSSQ